MEILRRKNAKGDKIFFYCDTGREAGHRRALNIFIYTRPKDQIQKNHNKEALKLVDVKKSELILDGQATGTGFLPVHKFKANFLDYYEAFVKANERKGNRHLRNSLTHFKTFIGKSFVSPVDINETLCLRFRQHLLDRFTGETPANYFAEFKKVIRAATKDNYWRHNPVDMLKSKTNASKSLKEILEVEDYLKLLRTPCFNEGHKDAFLFSCYTGLRWIDVKLLKWGSIKDGQLTSRIIQHKTSKPVIITLHPVAVAILSKRRRLPTGISDERVFQLSSQDGCNKIIEKWVKDAGIGKHITWSCARLSFSILLQDKRVDLATVAYLMGHTTTEQVSRTYKRHRPLDQQAAIAQLPSPEDLPYTIKENLTQLKDTYIVPRQPEITDDLPRRPPSVYGDPPA
jgi:integrase